MSATAGAEKVFPAGTPAAGGQAGGKGPKVDKKVLMWAGAGVVALLALFSTRGGAEEEEEEDEPMEPVEYSSLNADLYEALGMRDKPAPLRPINIYLDGKKKRKKKDRDGDGGKKDKDDKPRKRKKGDPGPGPRTHRNTTTATAPHGLPGPGPRPNATPVGGWQLPGPGPRPVVVEPPRERRKWRLPGPGPRTH